MATANFPMPSSIVMDEATATDTYGKFIASPYQSGFGHTIGNALRRVLLSSLEGAAISAVRIDGTAHEFASLPHVVEDVTEIILNLKKVKLKLNTDQPRTLEIKKKKAGPIIAAEIVGDGVEILNPEQIICTLDKDFAFRMEIEVSKGRGWRSAEQNKRPEHPLGTIPVDCLFSPVTHVCYKVGAARVGSETEMDSLTLEIETDGRVSPRDALEKASKILADHLRPFLGTPQNQDGHADQIPLDTEELRLFKILQQDVEVLDLSVRAMNCLNNANIKLLGELCMKPESRMLKYRNFGKKSLDEIKEKLSEVSLTLGMNFSENLTNAILAEAEHAKSVKKEKEEA